MKALMFLLCKTENFMSKSNLCAKVHLTTVEATRNNLMIYNNNKDKTKNKNAVSTIQKISKQRTYLGLGQM